MVSSIPLPCSTNTSNIRVHFSSIFRLIAIALIATTFYVFILNNIVRGPSQNMLPSHFKEAELGIPHPSSQSNNNLNGTHGTTANPRILIVSAMFPLAKSKHSKAEYRRWMKHFLGQITTDIYMYTTPEMVDTLLDLRGALPMYINSSFASPFDIPPLRGLERTYTRMNDVDREKFHHSPGLYAIWNAKPFLLDAAVEALGKEGEVYDYAFWNDAGSFRRRNAYTGWPDPARVGQIFEEGVRLTGKEKEELLFFPIFNRPNPRLKNWSEEMGPFVNPVQFSEGSFFGGSPATIAWFSKIFYPYHDYYISHFIFVGVDQDLFNSLFLLFPERIFTVWMDPQNAATHADGQRDIAPPEPSSIMSMEQNYLGECGDIWFYYQFWLADAPTRDSMRRMWMQEDWWKKLGWWQERKLCQLTTSTSMMEILKTSFGEEWRPPARSLRIPGL